MLKWNGKGTIEGVPARDLTEEEVRWYGGEQWLVKSGFYLTPAVENTAHPSPDAKPSGEGKKAVYRASENKAVYGGSEDK